MVSHWQGRDGKARLLVPVDGSPGALRAVDEAIALGRLLAVPAHIVAINVQVPLSGDIGLFIPDAELRRHHEEEGTRSLAKATARLRESGLGWESHVLSGPAVETLLQAEKQFDCQAIVISSRGVGGLREVLLGSVATQLLQLATTPVVLVR